MSEYVTDLEMLNEMETCDKCKRILFLVNIKIREKGNRIIPQLDRIYYCTRCKIIKTKGL